MKTTVFTWKIFQNVVLAVGIGIYTLSLAIFAYAGYFSRYWADDYCYSAVTLQRGLFGGVMRWYLTGGNRLSTVIAVWVSERFGPWAIAFIPALVITMWLCGWMLFLIQTIRLVQWSIPKYYLIFLALLNVYFCILLAPDRLQTLYWRMGTLHYTFPLTLMLINLALICHAIQQPKSGKIELVIIGCLAFIASGFSETFAALQTGLLACGALVGWIITPRERRRRVVLAFMIPMAASIVAMAIMVSSPANAWRQAVLPPPSSLWEFIYYTLRYSFDFVIDSVKTQPLPNLVYLISVMLVCYLLPWPTGWRISIRKAAIWAVLAVSLGFFLVVCCVAPSVYAGVAYPAGRALMPARFVFLTTCGVIAFIVGWVGHSIFKEQHSLLAKLAVVLLLMVSLYPLRMLPATAAEVHQMAVKAGRWDQRNSQIINARAQGQRKIIVNEVDVVQSLADLGPDPKFWVNDCAAQFYQVDSITARR